MAESTQLTPMPRPSRRVRKRDEQVRRLARRIRRADPALDVPSATLGVRRLAQLSLLSERLYERAKRAETGDDPQAFILAVESFRRCAQTCSLLEKNLRCAVSVVEPPSNLVLTMARTIRERREQAGAAVPFNPGED